MRKAALTKITVAIRPTKRPSPGSLLADWHAGAVNCDCNELSASLTRQRRRWQHWVCPPPTIGMANPFGKRCGMDCDRICDRLMLNSKPAKRMPIKVLR
jgi:hypothetical protein